MIILAAHRQRNPGEENVIEEYQWVRLVTDDWEYTERIGLIG